MVDLHVHSNRSDGTYSPRELVDYAMEKGLSAFALTDHDTVRGLEEAISYAASLRGLPSRHPVPRVIPGIEFSTEYEGRDIHIVGLHINYKDPVFTSRLQDFIDSRTSRNNTMCRLLREHGIDIAFEDLETAFPGAVITRAHYARYMLDRGYIKSISEAFDRYIGDSGPCFVPREKVTPSQAIELILEAGGIPVLAHPLLYRMGSARLEQLVSELKEAGLTAIECVYSTHSPAEEMQMRALAAKYGLLPGGGSDFHGENKPGLDLGVGYGKLCVSEEILEDLRKTRKKILFTDMDGTLLRKDSTISPAMWDGIRKLYEAGHHFVLSSGRPLPSILEVKQQQGIDSFTPIVISYNGSLVYDCASGKPLVSHRISLEDLSIVEKEARRLGIHVHAYSDTSIVATQHTKELDYYMQRVSLPLIMAGRFSDVLSEGPHKIQCICLDNKETLENFRQTLIPLLGERLQMVFSSDKYLELLPIQAGKGNAVRAVYEHLHIPFVRTYAAGDQENDISMLKAACHSIAVANARDEVKQAAGIVTKNSNDEDGLLEILEQFFMK